MNERIKRHIIRAVSISVVLILVIAISPIGAYPLGMIKAQADHWRGHYEVKTFGLRRSRIYDNLLLERYGIHTSVEAGCVVPIRVEYRCDGYNRVSRWHIKRQFGKDVFQECLNEAQAIWETEK